MESPILLLDKISPWLNSLKIDQNRDNYNIEHQKYNRWENHVI